MKALFKYFNSFIAAEPNSIDVLICAEAHRIRHTSANRFTPATKRTGRLQVDELISVARVPVLLLDEHQVVRPGEIGTVEAIEAAASARGLRVHTISLEGQFRCGGSAAYEEWVLQLLGLDGGAPQPWKGNDRFDVMVADSPMELEAILRLKHEKGFSARMAAGFCWSWSDPRDDGTLVPDVRGAQENPRPWRRELESMLTIAVPGQQA